MKKKIIFPILVLVLSLSLTLSMATALAKPTPTSPTGTYDYYVAAHAVVVNDGQEETAWADCNNSEQFNDGGSWAFCFGYPYGNNIWGLYAGNEDKEKGTRVGWVYVDIDDSSPPGEVYVHWWIDVTGWKIIETHIAVADTKAELPQNKNGNPKVGQFAIGGQKTGETFSPGLTSIIQTYSLNLNS